MYIYNATLDRLIGPVTMSVVLDLGFRTKAVIYVRLDGLTMPEDRKAAQAVTQEWFDAHQDFKVHTVQDKRQSFSRWFAEIFVDAGPSLNQVLLDSGLAKPYESGVAPDDEGS